MRFLAEVIRVFFFNLLVFQYIMYRVCQVNLLEFAFGGQRRMILLMEVVFYKNV